MQQHQRFIRPPDPQHHQPQRPPPQAASWYSSPQHFHYQAHPQTPPWEHPHHPTPTPTPMPPPPYPAHHTPPYSAHHYPPPPRPHHLGMGPTLPPHPPPQQGFHSHPTNQAWGNQNWSYQQGWDSRDINAPLNNEEDWAARARAWAAAKAAMENNQQITHSSQFTSPVVDRTEEQHNHIYHEHYQQSFAPSSHQELPVSLANNHIGPSFSSGLPSSYVSDGMPSSYSASRDGGAFGGAADANSSIYSHPLPPLHASVPAFYQQEVPNSYSSIPGSEEAGTQNEPLPSSMSLSFHQVAAGQLHSRSPLPANIGRSILAEKLHLEHRDPSAELIDAKERHDLLIQPISYVHPEPASGDHLASSSVHSWAPAAAASGGGFPSIHSPIPSVQQYDPSFLSPSAGSAPVFGRNPGSTGFHSTIPPPVTVGTAFSLGGGHTAALHPTSVFPGDVNGGVFNIAERPKKAPVPNWLREEIIKNKSTIASSQNHRNERRDSSPPIESGGEDSDKLTRKGYQSDSKSIDSTSKSNEYEEDDEDDDVEAARSAAINQDIKRILTEVLLKVTDELFDEIATKVLNEDDLIDEALHRPENAKEAPTLPSIPTPKATAKVLIPLPIKGGRDTDGFEDRASTGKSSSSSPGNVLGLANYVSDDEEDEVQSSPSGVPLSGQKRNDVLKGVVDNDLSKAKFQEANGVDRDKEIDDAKAGPECGLQNLKALLHTGINGVEGGALTPGGKGISEVYEDNQRKVENTKIEIHSVSESTNAAALGGEHDLKSEPFSHQVDVSTGKHFDTEKENREHKKEEKDVKKEERDTKKEKRDERKTSLKEERDERKASLKEEREERRFSSKEKDERKVGRKEDKDYRRVSSNEDRVKDRGVKHGEKNWESDSRNLHKVNSKDGRKETEEGVKRFSSDREDGSHRKREWSKDDKEDRSTRHRDVRNSDKRYKRRRSSSASRGRKSSRDNSLGSDDDSGSSEEASKKSRNRKQQVNRRTSSPSPSRSRRRQVSRSPHRKHSHRRDSPYSSLDTRRRRSRSSTPVRRR